MISDSSIMYIHFDTQDMDIYIYVVFYNLFSFARCHIASLVLFSSSDVISSFRVEPIHSKLFISIMQLLSTHSCLCSRTSASDGLHCIHFCLQNNVENGCRQYSTLGNSGNCLKPFKRVIIGHDRADVLVIEGFKYFNQFLRQYQRERVRS